LCQANQQAKADQQMTQFAQLLDDVAHQHAVERGLSAGFLAGNTQLRSALIAQRQAADVSSEAFLQAAKLMPEAIQKQAQALITQLGQRSGIRLQIDRQNSPQMFAFYSRVNALALAQIAQIASRLGSVEQRLGLQAALTLAWHKERLGHIRGFANGILTRGEMTVAEKVKLSSFADALQAAQGQSQQSLVGASQIQYRDIVSSQGNQTIKATLNSLLSGKADVQAVTLSPAQWFATNTGVIKDIKGLVNAQWQENITLASAQYRISMWLFTATVTLVGVFFVAMVFINRHAISLLRNEIRFFTQVMSDVSQKGDLTQNFNNTSNELGQLSEAIVGCFNVLRERFASISGMVEEQDKLANNLAHATNKVKEHASHTHQLTASLAAATEEMSATSREIAQSASVTNQLANDVATHVGEAVTGLQSTKDATDVLAKNIDAIKHRTHATADQVNSINNLLATITSLSEQTNLLSLNAAIEAARAGEHGRGFAVVADEVRTLATTSNKATQEIADILSTLKDSSQQTLNAVDAGQKNIQNMHAQVDLTYSQFDALNEQSQAMSQQCDMVAAAAEEQSVTITQMAHEITSVADASEHEMQATHTLQTVFTELQYSQTAITTNMRFFKF
jgi:methyl-accepting chemotaxis protein